MHEQYPIDVPARREIAAALLGEIDWPRGYCRCPGAEAHTNKSGRTNRVGRDCRVYLEPSAQNPRGVPSIKCVHTSCEGVVAEVNRKLRSEIAKHEARKAKDEGYVMPAPRRRGRTREERERAVNEMLQVRLAKRAALNVAQVLEEYAWSQYDMYEASSTLSSALDEPLGQARALLSLFRPSDIVWCGEHGDSFSAEDEAAAARAASEVRPAERREVEKLRWRIAKVKERRPFRTAQEWIEMIGREGTLPGPRITPSAFKSGVWSRSDAAIAARRFLVIEHDKLSLDEQAAMLRWLSLRVFQPGALRAVVWTGGKSLHGWFDASLLSSAKLEELKVVLCGVRVTKLGGSSELVGGMGFDPATFVPSQAYRVPGWKHDKTGETCALWFLGNDEGRKC